MHWYQIAWAGQFTIQGQSCSSQEIFKHSSPCLNSSILHWAPSCGQPCSNIVQHIWPATGCKLSVSTVRVCEWEVHSLWSWTASLAFVKDSWKGRKLSSRDLRCSNVQLAVNARSWPIITNTWQALSHNVVSIPILTAGVNLHCQITSRDQTAALHGAYNSLCWWPWKVMRCWWWTLLEWRNKLNECANQQQWRLT